MKYLLIFLLALAVFVISVTLGTQNDQQVTFSYLSAQGEYRISTLLVVLSAARFVIGWLTCGLSWPRVHVFLACAERKTRRLENQFSPATDMVVVPHSSAAKGQLSMLGSLFLFLPVVVAYGWYMDRRSTQ